MATDKFASYKKILYGNDSTSTSISSNQKKINNYSARLEAAGIAPKKATDSRNIVEKALNLKEDQNALFDLFEILGRPQQALFGAWEASQKGGNALEGAKKGLTGEKTTRFKDILTNYGMEDTKGKLDVSDVLGFVGDVAIDPMDIVPIVGFSKFDDALKAGASLKSAAKNLKTGSDLVTAGISKGIKGTATALDKTAEKVLTKLDETQGIVDNITGEVTKLKYLNPTAKTAANLMPINSATNELTNTVGRLQNYKQLKNDIANIAVVPESIKKAFQSYRATDAEKDRTRLEAAVLNSEGRKLVENYAAKTGADAEQIGKDLALFLESNANRTIDNKTLLSMAKNGDLADYDEVITTLNKMVEDSIPEKIRNANPELFKIAVDDKTHKIKLGKGFDVYKDINTDGFTTIAKRYTPEQQARINKINKKYLDDAEYRDLFDTILGSSWRRNPSDLTTLQGDIITKNQQMFFDTPNGNGEGLSNIKLNSANNLTPVNSDNIFDVEENAKPIKRGLIDMLNEQVDKNLGTKLTDKYSYLTNDNYIPHTLTKEGQDIVEDFNRILGKQPSYGNKRLLSSRTRLGSIEEINTEVSNYIKQLDAETLANYPKLAEFNKKNSKFMEDNFFQAISNKYLDPKTSVINNAAQVSKANEILVKGAFSNAEEMINLKDKIKTASELGDTFAIPELTKKLNKLEDGANIKILSKTDSTVPKGFTRLTNSEITELTDKFDTMNKQLGINGGFGDLSKALKKYGGDVAIDNTILRMFRRTTDETTKTGLSKLYNTYINSFRKWKTASPTFLLNNLVGNSSNLTLSGISPAEQAKYGMTVKEIMENGENYSLARLLGNKVTKKQSKIADLWEQYRALGFDTSALELNEMPKEIKELFTGERKLSGFKDYLVNGIPYFNNLMNNKMDMSARLTVMLKCIDDPSYIKSLGVSDTYEAISKVMFDPRMLTEWETKTAKNLFPFYTYAKNNLMYHVTNIGNNGRRYNQLIKEMQGLQRLATNDNEENMAEYLKNSLYIPIPGVDKDGNYKVLRASLPFGQFVETVDDPLGQVVNTLTPAVKAPIENLLGRSTYTGRDIEKFPGEMSKNIPFLTKKQEKFLSDISGLDVPIKQVSRFYEGLSDSFNNEDNNIAGDILNGINNTITMTNNIKTDELYKTYEQIDELQNIIKKYKQKGYNIATLSELQRANKNGSIAGINAIFNKYGIK